MGAGVALAVLGGVVLAVASSSRKGSSWVINPPWSGVDPLPNPEYVPAVNTPPWVMPPNGVELPPIGGDPLARAPGALASVMSRVVTAASSGNPTTMRAEAALLRAQGWPDQAGDLEELARRTDQLRAVVSPVPTPAPVVLPPVSPPIPVKPPVIPMPAPAPAPPDPRPPVVPPGVQPAPAVSMLGLRKGAVGAAVTAWQTVLRADGHGHIPLASNTFGPDTEQATRDLQEDRGMTATGVVDQQTLNLAPLPAILGKRLLQDGSRGGAVKAWQRVLVTSGQTQVLIDGWFAGETVTGTKYWQKARKLDPDGRVGPGTIGAMGLSAAVASVLPITTAAVTAAVQAIYPTTFDPKSWRKYLSSGMVGADVSEWQAILSRDGFPSHPDGKFGPETISSTKAWQLSRTVSPADGVVGPDVRAAIVLTPRAVVSGFDVPQPWRELRPTAPLPGMSLQAPTEQVAPDRSLAAKLAHNLYLAPEGSEDKALIRLFQEVMGLQATGAYGPSTAQALIAYGLVPPHPRAWPSKGSTKVRARYVAELREQARRDPSRALEWNAAAARAVAQ